MLIHEYLRWKPKPRVTETEPLQYDENFAMQVLRLRGEKAYKDYLNLFTPEKEEVLPKLLIFKTCRVLIEAIKACSYDDKKIEDIAEFDGDDPIDALRYILDAADSFVKSAGNELEMVQKRALLEERMKSNPDMTSFYMMARKLDEGSALRGVKRYRRH